MSAETLRRAAKLLREHAGATRPGVWVGSQDVRREANAAGRHHGSRLTAGDAHWIALMQPSVGLALADWLEAEADALETSIEIDGFDAVDMADGWSEALTTARAVLREEAPDER